jgi:hypothetical protein
VYNPVVEKLNEVGAVLPEPLAVRMTEDFPTGYRYYMLAAIFPIAPPADPPA